MFTESDLLPLSGLQHLAFCERQWGLIHLEQVWMENRLTAEGRALHKRSDSAQREVRGNTITVRTLRINSLRLGLAGQTDVVEFHRDDSVVISENRAAETAVRILSVVRLPETKGWWRPVPVEYKRGSPKPYHCDMVQLCAQAICLEEMLGCTIGLGNLYYGKQHRRQEVRFSASLRQETEDLSLLMHRLFDVGITSPPIFDPKCESCSLKDVCQPKSINTRRSVNDYLRRSLTP